MEITFSTPAEARRWLYLMGWIGLLGSLLVGCGEFLVHYAGDAMHGGPPYSFFLEVPAERLPPGHFLMVLGLPLYLLGYGHFFLALRPGNRKLAAAVFLLGAVSFSLGGVWAGSRAFLGSVVQILGEASDPQILSRVLESYDFLQENLVQVLRVLVLANSVLFVGTVLRYKTLYPRWMAVFNPALVLAIVFSLFFYLPAVGDFLAPTAMNVAYFVHFGMSLVALRRPL